MNHINNNNVTQQTQHSQSTAPNNTSNTMLSSNSMQNLSVTINNTYNNNQSMQQPQLTNNHKQLLRCYSQDNQQNTINSKQLATAQLHQVLARAQSSPQGNGTPSSQHISLVLNSLIENFGGHRRLERTQSEPAPQLLKAQAAQAALAQINTSRYKTELCR